LATFLSISIVLIIIPGQDMALTTRNTLIGGRTNGVFTALGVVTGLAIWALATSAGLAALLRGSEPAFLAVKLIGAAYLIFLGGQTLWSAVRTGDLTHAAGAVRGPSKHPPAAALRQGVVSNLGNPKIAVFFTSLLPQFTTNDEGSFAALLGLGLLFCGLTFVWLTAYALAVARARDVLLKSRIRRALDAVTGAVLIGFGVRLATEQR
ncbi:MAG TPA: LysE family translocator, partial [Chloroflexota bacterium]|nr:LysE family translocator [Chloroflexota bacterium]